jgi:cellulose biosynthesis protein BcsQ
LVRRHGDTTLTQAEGRPALLGRLNDLLGANKSAGLDTDIETALRSRTVAFTGLSGGAGATTILATLGAMLSGSGKRILIVDGEPTVLPLFFGGRSCRSGLMAFQPRRAGGSMVQILAASERLTAGNQAAEDAWLWDGLKQLGGDVDKVLLECWPAMGDRSKGWALGAALQVIVITPDPAALVRLPRLLHTLGDRTEDDALAPYLLLNKFSPEVSLHVEIRELLSREFGERLLPFSIRRSDSLAEALAAGMTVVEWEPESPVANDFIELVQWLNER